MDGLVAPHSENRGAEDRVGVAVNHDFYKSLRFPLLDSTADARHRPAAYRGPRGLGPGLGLCQADPAKRRIDIEGVNGNAVAHLPVAPSSKFAAAISKSLYEVWVKAPRRLQSPSAQMWGTLVFRVSSTTGI